MITTSLNFDDFHQHQCIAISNTIYVDIWKRIGEVAGNSLLLLLVILSPKGRYHTLGSIYLVFPKKQKELKLLGKSRVLALLLCVNLAEIFKIA